MGRLTTHVLDTANGHPAHGLEVELFAIAAGAPILLTKAVTNQDGRCDAPLLEGGGFLAGTYELRFHVGAYFARLGRQGGGFLDMVPVRFLVEDSGAHYHVPLLVSPFGYSTYRGS